MPVLAARKYDEVQRRAVVQAYRGVGRHPGKTAQAVSELAAAGELRDARDTPLDPFAIPPSSVRNVARRERKSEAGEVASKLADMSRDDAGQVLRRRLLSMVDDQTKRLQRRTRGRQMESSEAELLRQLARGAREAAALPGPGEARPLAPGEGVRGRGATRDGLAGAILKAPMTQRGRDLLAAARKDDARRAEEPPAIVPEPVTAKHPPQPATAGAAREVEPEPGSPAALGREVQRRMAERFGDDAA